MECLFNSFVVPVSYFIFLAVCMSCPSCFIHIYLVYGVLCTLQLLKPNLHRILQQQLK